MFTTMLNTRGENSPPLPPCLIIDLREKTLSFTIAHPISCGVDLLVFGFFMDYFLEPAYIDNYIEQKVQRCPVYLPLPHMHKVLHYQCPPLEGLHLL